MPSQDTSPDNEPKTLKAVCAICSGERNCDVKGEHLQGGGDEYFNWYSHWRILQCRGCDYVFVRRTSGNSEEHGYSYGPHGEEIYEEFVSHTYWPSSAKRTKPEWMSESGIEAPNVEALDLALVELYGALDAGLTILSAIGIRTCFDIASELLKIDPNQTFDEKLDALVKAEHIVARDRSRVAVLVEAGSASAHRGWRPTGTQINTMMDILEYFILDAFVAPARRSKLDEKAAEMQAGVPAREKRKPKGKAGATPPPENSDQTPPA